MPFADADNWFISQIEAMTHRWSISFEELEALALERQLKYEMMGARLSGPLVSGLKVPVGRYDSVEEAIDGHMRRLHPFWVIGLCAVIRLVPKVKTAGPGARKKFTDYITAVESTCRDERELMLCLLATNACHEELK
jgi:hypothetical protein